MTARRFDVAERCRVALGTGKATASAKLIVATGLGRDVGLDRIVGEPVYPGRSDMPDEVELWVWLAWQMCEHEEWGKQT